MVAIPQSGLLAQVRLFWLRVGHSCPILTKHCSLHLPCLPALPPLVSGRCRHLRCFSTGGVTVGFNYLFIFPSCYVALYASKARHRLGRESVSWCFETSLLKIPFPGRASLPRMELPPQILCLLFHLLYFFLPVFEDNDLLFWWLMSSASIQKLFCGIYSELKCSFDEFVREKVVSPSYSSYSSTILGPPLSLLLNMLSRLVITFLPRSKHLLISWLQSPSAVPAKLSSGHRTGKVVFIPIPMKGNAKEF